MIKYNVKPGFIISYTTGEAIYLDFQTLCWLYGVGIEECLNDSEDENLIVLAPREDWVYVCHCGKLNIEHECGFLEEVA